MRQFFGKYSFEEYLEMFDKPETRSWRKKAWCHFIKEGKMKCVVTGNKITHVRRVEHLKGGSIHFDFYNEEDVMFNLDHIIPKSKGGGENIENLQIMTEWENSKKGNKIVQR